MHISSRQIKILAFISLLFSCLVFVNSDQSVRFLSRLLLKKYCSSEIEWYDKSNGDDHFGRYRAERLFCVIENPAERNLGRTTKIIYKDMTIFLQLHQNIIQFVLLFDTHVLGQCGTVISFFSQERSMRYTKILSKN